MSLLSKLARVARRALVLMPMVVAPACASVDGLTTFSSSKHEAPSPTPPADPNANAGAPSTDLYHAAFGDPKNQAVVFVHGGPGSNSVMLEDSGVAGALASAGYYVVTYDQRGSGRSPRGVASDFTFDKSAKDLDDLIHSLKLERPILMGHSFGGTLVLNYLERHPDVAKGALTIANPVDFPDSYFNVHELCTSFFKKRLKVLDLQSVSELHLAMFPKGLEPPFTFTAEEIGKTMQMAKSCMLYLPTFPTAHAAATWARLTLGPNGDLMNSIEPAVGNGFQDNEHVGYQQFVPVLAKHAAHIYGIYGDQDGMLTASQLERITTTLSPSHVTVLEGAGHFLWVDQEDPFLRAATTYLALLRAAP